VPRTTSEFAYLKSAAAAQRGWSKAVFIRVNPCPSVVENNLQLAKDTPPRQLRQKRNRTTLTSRASADAPKTARLQCRRKKAAGKLFVNVTPIIGAPLETFTQTGVVKLVVICKTASVPEAAQKRTDWLP
jgi:hypothetical protein